MSEATSMRSSKCTMSASPAYRPSVTKQLKCTAWPSRSIDEMSSQCGQAKLHDACSADTTGCGFSCRLCSSASPAAWAIVAEPRKTHASARKHSDADAASADFSDCGALSGTRALPDLDTAPPGGVQGAAAYCRRIAGGSSATTMRLRCEK